MNIAVIVTTKDRSDCLENLLNSISKSSLIPECISIVSAGKRIDNIINNYSFITNILHKHSEIAGQVYQRNLALAPIKMKYDLFAFLDDDVIVDSNFFAQCINFFSEAQPNTGGVGTKLIPAVNAEKSNGELFSVEPMSGKVTRSGHNFPYTNGEKTKKVQWLNGLSIWTRDVINEFQHPDISNRYAAAEDLIFSYKVGKKYVLYYEPTLILFEQEIPNFDYSESSERHATLWQHRLFFVLDNKELSVWQYVKTLVADTLILNLRNLQKSGNEINKKILSNLKIIKYIVVRKYISRDIEKNKNELLKIIL